MIGYEREELQFFFGSGITRRRWYLSLWMRIGISLYGLITMFLMVVTRADPTAILLNFTAVQFVTHLDNIIFELCAWGYFGIEAQINASKVVAAEQQELINVKQEEKSGSLRSLNQASYSNMKQKSLKTYAMTSKRSLGGVRAGQFHRRAFMIVLILTMLIAWTFVSYRQMTGYYVCQTMYVQFGDAVDYNLATFSGFYLFNVECNGLVCKRGEYIEAGHGKYKDTARFGYCEDVRAWTFSHGESPADKIDTCQWRAKSIEMDSSSVMSYDIETIFREEWLAVNKRGAVVPMTSINLKCMDCTSHPDFCGGKERGSCVVSNSGEE
jgi:hypothetical protein